MNYQRGYYIDKDGMLYWIERGKFGGFQIHDQREEFPTHAEQIPGHLQFLGTMWECQAVQSHLARVPECVA